MTEFHSGRTEGTDINELISTSFRLLLDDGSVGTIAWQRLHQLMSRSYEALSAQMGRHLDEEDLLHMLGLLLVSIGQNGFKTAERKSHLFDLAPAMGIHVMPVHFYSPVPDTSSLSDSIFAAHFDTMTSMIDAPAQLRFLASLRDAAAELSNILMDHTEDGHFYWNNPAFGP